MPKISNQEWLIDGLSIPVRIIKEWRNSNRISINKDKVIIRIPTVGAQFSSYENWAKSWLIDQFIAHPEVKSRFVLSAYQSGDLIHLPEKSYSIDITEAKRKTSSAKLRDTNSICLFLNEELSEREKTKAVKTLVSRIIAQDNLPIVTERILELNDQYFKEAVKSVRLKNNSSNWGSCSSNGNINISIRTLFAPSDVRDYVYIHELSHLKELNHSSRFWKIVSDIMPDYRSKEDWLKKNGKLCNI